MRVPTRVETRFERRWSDYRDVLEHGTNPEVGTSKPAPPDVRTKIWALRGRHMAELATSADKVLDDVWHEDSGRWQRRLNKAFLAKLGTVASRSFARLVESGCQPDTLAFHFYRCSRPEDLVAQEATVRSRVTELDQLLLRLRQALKDFSERRKALDEYLLSHRLRVTEDEPGGASLNILRLDMELELDDQQDELRRLHRQIDGRRQPIVGHAQVRLSRQIHEVTGKYHDRSVASVLTALGTETVTADALKRRRARWAQRLGS